MKLAFSLVVVTWIAVCPLFASESALDCHTASQTLIAGLESQPEHALPLFLDSLQANPGCRNDLLQAAVEFTSDRPQLLEQVIFIARQEFPEEQTSLAEVALTAAPEQSELIRHAFFAMLESDSSSSEGGNPGEEPLASLVTLPEEAEELDDDIREAIARMAAKVEGKTWPEQSVDDESLRFRQPDDVRVSLGSYFADETSLENAIPIDTVDERRSEAGTLRIRDWKSKREPLRLDESKFHREDTQDATSMKEARKREIAPAGAVEFPSRPTMSRSAVYYIPPAGGDFRSTIDLDDERRPSLVIRPKPAFRPSRNEGENP